MEEEVAALVRNASVVPYIEFSIRHDRSSIMVRGCARQDVGLSLRALGFWILLSLRLPSIVAGMMASALRNALLLISVSCTSKVMMPPVPSSRKSTSSLVDPSGYIFSTSSIVGRPRHQGIMVGMGQKDSYVGSVSHPSHLRDLTS